MNNDNIKNNEKDIHQKNEFIVIKKLINLYEQFVNFFKEKILVNEKGEFYEDFNKFDDILIVFHSLIQCIIEYPIIEESTKEKLKELLNGNTETDLEDNILSKLIIDFIEFKDYQDDEKINELTNKSFFILNTITLLDILRVKFLNKEDIKQYLFMLWSKIFILIKVYFSVIVYLDKKKLLNLRIDKIKEDKETLFDLYMGDNAENKQIFNSILLNYRFAFFSYKNGLVYYNDTKSLFYINNKKIYLENITKFIIKTPWIDGDGNELLLLFSFLQDIHDVIDVRLTKNTNIKLLNTLIPENFNLNKYSFLYFEKHIDYTDRETKLLSIYNYIECLIYDMKKKKNLFDYWLNYRFLELINYFGILTENIFMIIFYSKSIEESIEYYNKIDNRQKFKRFSIVIGSVHIFILIIVIYAWFICRFFIEYLYAIKKYKIENSIKCPIFANEEIKSLDIVKDEKSKLNLDINKYCQDDFLYFESLRDLIKNIEKKFEIFFYTSRTIYPFYITLICLILFLVGWQLALVIPLFLVFNLSETLLGIIKVLFKEFFTLFLLLLFMINILYFFSWFGFFYIPKMFKYESVDKNNELIGYEENICSSAISCILYFWNFGMTSEGIVDMNLISFKNNYTNYLVQFFFDLILYGLIHMIFFNVFLATITDSFGEMRDKIREKDEDIKKSCFICQMTENDCVNEFKDFEEHCQKHNKWKYIMFICNILQKEKTELNKEEYIIYKKILDKNIDWFPKYKKPNEIKKLKKAIDENKTKIEGIEQKINKFDGIEQKINKIDGIEQKIDGIEQKIDIIMKLLKNN